MLSTDKLDVLLNDDHDWTIVNGDFAFVTGGDGVAQLIEVAVKMFKGEWFVNIDEGVPYFERQNVPRELALLGRHFNEARAVRAISDVILAQEGVAGVNSIEVQFDAVTRVLVVRYSVRYEFDDVVTTASTGETRVEI